jgi:hypothetical protein
MILAEPSSSFTERIGLCDLRQEFQQNADSNPGSNLWVFNNSLCGLQPPFPLLKLTINPGKEPSY